MSDENYNQLFESALPILKTKATAADALANTLNVSSIRVSQMLARAFRERRLFRVRELMGKRGRPKELYFHPEALVNG